jgi:hypothetical protein
MDSTATLPKSLKEKDDTVSLIGTQGNVSTPQQRAQIKECCQACLIMVFAFIILLMMTLLLAVGAGYIEEASLSPTGRAVRQCMRECRRMNITKHVNNE